MDVQIRALDRAVQMGYSPFVDGPPPYPPVFSEPIHQQDGTVIGGYQRIAREDTGDTLAIHTSSYELMPFGESFAHLDAAVQDSTLDRTNLMIKTEYSHNGARCFRSYLFPHINMAARTDDIISLQILAFDSYDGSYSRAIAAGGFRHICTNGMFFGKSIEQLRVKHTRNAATRFINGLEKVMAAAETFTAMQPRIVAMTGVAMDPFRLKDYFISRFVTEAEEQTLYGAWNLLTSWASHSEGTAQTRIDRDRRVAALVDSREWRRLEDA